MNERLVTEFNKYAGSIALLSVEREALTNNVGDCVRSICNLQVTTL